MAERYIGIDLNEKYAMISYYTSGMSEPVTFSLVTGSEVYQIPVCVSKKRGIGQWFCGEEARRRSREEGTICIESLLKRALASESVEIEGTFYDASELLFIFLRKLMALPMQQTAKETPDALVITLEYVNQEARRLFGLFAEKLKLPVERLMLLDYRESFYYYALNQPAELYIHDVALYYYTAKKLLCWRLSRDRRTTPQVVTIEEMSYDAVLKDYDTEFAKIVDVSLSGHMISSVYLIGDGFDGGWMQKSLGVICRNRRAFMGKNLFSKGACYGAAVKDQKADWAFIYMGDNELKMNVSLQVINQGKTEWISLITAGDNWYEAMGECEVILKGTPTLDFWFQPPRSKEAVIRSLNLTDMPEREDKTTRLRITVKPLSADTLQFCIRDMGFGEIEKMTDKVWEYNISC